MNRIENGMYTTIGWSTHTYKFFRYITACGKKCLKRLSKYLFCTKYNKINICHSDIAKHVFYKNDAKIHIFYLKAHTKVFPYITSYERIILKHILTYLYMSLIL